MDYVKKGRDYGWDSFFLSELEHEARRFEFKGSATKGGQALLCPHGVWGIFLM